MVQITLKSPAGIVTLMRMTITAEDDDVGVADDGTVDANDAK